MKCPETCDCILYDCIFHAALAGVYGVGKTNRFVSVVDAVPLCWMGCNKTSPTNMGLLRNAAVCMPARHVIGALHNTSRVPVEGKSSVCLICMKYMIIILIICHYQPGSNVIIVY